MPPEAYICMQWMSKAGGATGFRIEPLAWASKFQSERRNGVVPIHLKTLKPIILKNSLGMFLVQTTRSTHLLNRFLRLDRLFFNHSIVLSTCFSRISNHSVPDQLIHDQNQLWG